MGRLRKISSVVITISLAFFAIGGIATVFFNRPSSHFKALNVATGSMRPGMPPGSLAIVHSVPAPTLKVGDVITYANPHNAKETITHRIVEVKKSDGKLWGYVTKGDANEMADAPILSGQVIGKRVIFIPYLGKIISWTRSWFGIALLIYLPALLIIIEEIKRMAKYYKEQLPYRVPSFEKRLQAMANKGHHTAIGVASGVGILLVGVIIAMTTAHAVAVNGPQQSNTVALAPNTLVVQSGNGGGTTCTNHNNVNVHNSSNQSASTGNVSNSNNTNGGSATSGNASNSNSSSTTITITGC